jgi:hypothetical protein
LMLITEFWFGLRARLEFCSWLVCLSPPSPPSLTPRVSASKVAAFSFAISRLHR